MSELISDKQEDLQIVREVLLGNHGKVMPKGDDAFRFMVLPIIETAVSRQFLQTDIRDITLNKV